MCAAELCIRVKEMAVRVWGLCFHATKWSSVCVCLFVFACMCIQMRNLCWEMGYNCKCLRGHACKCIQGNRYT